MEKEGIKEEKFFGSSVGIKRLTWAGRIIFFFDVFLALMIITGAGTLVKTEFGKVALVFGLVMLAFTVFLRAVGKW